MKPSISYPKNLLRPIREYLEQRERKLNKQKEELSKEDPFSDSDRLKDMAAVDSGAGQKFGHARLEAMGNELEKMLIIVRKSLTKIKLGKYGICDDCGEMIDTDRLSIDPSTLLCVKCATKKSQKR